MLYQISVLTGYNNHHAGSKAVNDATIIARKKGFNDIEFYNPQNKNKYLNKLYANIDAFRRGNAYVKEIESNSIIFVQYPLSLIPTQINRFLKKLKKEKHVKVIALVHDVRLLVLGNQKMYQKEIDDMVSISDVMIVHNYSMVEWFVTRVGVDRNRLVDLRLFDYLSTEKIVHPVFDKSIIIAGNLKHEKSGYIYKLRNVENVKFYLYGPNYEGTTEKNIIYCGSVSPDVLPRKLDKGFGLVWDGTCCECCDGLVGEYLRYNNPHKLSLYISSCMPVFIWKESAEAKFVEEHKIGFCISQLYEIEQIMKSITEKEYLELVNNVEKLAIKVREGYFETKAMDVAIERLENVRLFNSR